MTMRQWARAALVLALGACAIPQEEGSKRSYGKRDPGPLVRVTNHNYLDVNLYVVQAGTRWRLGTVTGNSARNFRVPPDRTLETAEIRIQADPIGGVATYLSQPVYLRRGQEMDLIIGPSMPLSSLAVSEP
jgi:hypothetical protein